MIPPHSARCLVSHLGLYACEPGYVRRAVAAIKAGAHPMRAFDDEGRPVEPKSPYAMVGDGVAALRLDGALAKGFGKYTGTSTAWARRSIRAAVADPKVSSILLVVDSPGGYVDGTQDLADDVAAANEQKPVVAYVEDLAASAAYWIASQAGKVYANATAMVGSIGVFSVVEDMSKAAEIAGVTVHVISTGPLKGAGAPGAPVTEDQVAAWQTQVDDTMAFFEGSVRRGRSMTSAAFEAVSTGDVWIAEKAKGLGLIDGVRSLDRVVAGMPKPRRAK